MALSFLAVLYAVMACLPLLITATFSPRQVSNSTDSDSIWKISKITSTFNASTNDVVVGFSIKTGPSDGDDNNTSTKCSLTQNTKISLDTTTKANCMPDDTFQVSWDANADFSAPEKMGIDISHFYVTPYVDGVASNDADSGNFDLESGKDGYTCGWKNGGKVCKVKGTLSVPYTTDTVGGIDNGIDDGTDTGTSMSTSILVSTILVQETATPVAVA